MDGMNTAAVYKQRFPANTYKGMQAIRIIGTYINWKRVDADPAVIAENSARIKGRIKIHKDELSQEPVAVVGFGPSLTKTWERLRNFKVIYTCSGAHKFLIEHGIVPTYHVDSDPRAYKADILGEPHPDVTYLLASICHPTYFDKLELHHAKVKLWHMLFLDPEIFAHFPKNEWIMTGGHTVGPRSIKIARMMGYANLHMFGFDGSVEDGQTHTTEHPHPPTDLDYIEYGGRMYLTNNNWQEHAEILLKDFDRMPEVSYQFYGEGLIQAMARDHVRITRAAMPMRVYKDENERCVW